jgi:hypothetical protein
MRCVCCNRNLNDYESTLRHGETGEFLDTCTKCLKDINVPTRGRGDLNPFESSDDVDYINIFESNEDNDTI